MAKPKRAVVAVDTDGSMKWAFDSRHDAEQKLSICHKDMGRALKDHNRHVKGYTWWYEDEYRNGWFTYGEEHFAWTPDPNRKRRGSGFAKGHTLGNGRQHWSEESRQRQSERSRAVCFMRKERGDYERQAKKQCKRVRCVKDGMEFESVKACGLHYGIPQNQISGSISRNGTTRNLKFEYI